MDRGAKIKLFLVDDDAIFLKLLEIDFRTDTNFEIGTYSTGELCIENLSDYPDLIILDYNLDGINKNAMNGMETLDKIKAFNPNIQVVMLSSQDNLEVAINCIDHGAFDYVIKSETVFIQLNEVITTIFIHRKMEKRLNWYIHRM